MPAMKPPANRHGANMNLSTKASDAQTAACRIPALTALLALLELQNPDAAHLDFYPDPRPDPGDTPAGSVVVAVELAATAGAVDTDLFQLQLTAPLEEQITGADPATGTTVTWARVVDGDGDWFADLSVSDEAGSGEIKLQTTLLYNGAYCRITSAIFQG